MNLTALRSYVEQQFPGRFFVDAPMSDYTSFHIGGPADLLVDVQSEDEIASLMTQARHEEVPVVILGNGSNLLVRDGGIRGLVIKIGNNLNTMRVEGQRIIAGAGVSLAAVSNRAQREGLTGLEFAVGIPGSLGGAVLMNAGAYDGEMAFVVESVAVLTPAGQKEELSKDQLAFSYRHSSLQDDPAVITEVVFHLQKGDPEQIRAKMDDFTNRRRTKQPLDLPSAGSMFKRPNGYFAAALIDQAGLRGYRVGDAQVSEKHTGFVVNRGHATAGEVLQLIHDVQEKVLAHAGVRLEPEVRIIGED
jgi:UDP-N-acetylmuramate dehydrogenase